ncbi:MAG: hypothetical protein KGQ57_00100 [Burkholderiales bacterium]|nr:hypothetical protein [Burkholderiales bacterium]
MFLDKALAFLLCSVCVVSARAETPHLTLDDIDQLSRAKVVDALKGNPPASAPAGATVGAAASTPPVVPAGAAGPVSRASAAKPAAHGDPITFVGAYRDAAGAHVLYEYDGAVYPSLTGRKLLNGWTAEKVAGFVVTVKLGRDTWTETIRGGALSAPIASPSLQAINDLGGPLPPGGMTGLATPIRLGR